MMPEEPIPPKEISVHVGRPFVILVSLAIHFTLGVCLLYKTANSSVLALSGLDSFGKQLHLSTNALAVLLIFLSMLALIGVMNEKRWPTQVCATLVVWQYGIMLWALSADLLICLHRSVTTASGTVVDRSTVIAVLCPIAYIAVGHTLAFLERYTSVLETDHLQKFTDWRKGFQNRIST